MQLVKQIQLASSQTVCECVSSNVQKETKLQSWRREWQSVRLIDRKAVDSPIRLSDSHFQIVFWLARQFDDDDSNYVSSDEQM